MNASLEYFPTYLQTWDRSFVRVIELVAKKAADLTIGEGIIINSHDERIQEFFDKLVDRTQLSTKLWKFAYMNSKIGRSHLWLVKNELGEFDFVLSEILSSTRVSIYNEIEVAAQIFTTKNQGDRGWYYQIDFFEDKCRITSYIDDKITQVGSVITQIPDSARWVDTLEYKTNIGIVPIIETTNLPKPKLFVENTFTFFPDWEPVVKLINDLQEVIKQKRKERKKNQTWFNGVLTPQLLEKVVEAGGDLTETLKDGLIQSNINGYTKGNTMGFDITYGNPPMDQYNADWLFTEIQIFNGCGYNHPRETEFQSYTNKAQTLVNAILDEQTTRVKQQYYRTKLYRLLDFILISEGLWDRDKEWQRPYDIDFKSIGLSDILQKDQLINSRLSNGTMSREQAIQEYEGINAFNAKRELDNISEEQQKDNWIKTYYGWSQKEGEENNDNDLNVDVKEEVI